MKKKGLLLGMIVVVSALCLLIAACDDPFKKNTWTPARRALSPPWDTYLVGENTTNTSGSVYGNGSSTKTFDGTNVVKSSSYQHWQGGSKFSTSTWYITRIELNQKSWESYPRWRIFYKLESSFWYSEADFNAATESDMTVPTVLNGKRLEDYVEIPGP